MLFTSIFADILLFSTSKNVSRLVIAVVALLVNMLL